MTVLVALTLVCVTVMTPATAPASLPFVVLAMVTVAASLSAIVFVATKLAAAPSEAAPDVTAVRVMITVSLPSTIRSSITGIEIVAVVAKAGIVMVPLKAVKSLPDVAVPATEYDNVTAVGRVADIVTVITPFTGPVSLPLVVLAMVTVGASLSAIVLVAVMFAAAPNATPGDPDVMLVKVMITVSLPSTTASSMTGMVMVAVVEPAGIVTVPLKAV